VRVLSATLKVREFNVTSWLDMRGLCRMTCVSRSAAAEFNEDIGTCAVACLQNTRESEL
jgi:hypothetical protein